MFFGNIGSSLDKLFKDLGEIKAYGTGQKISWYFDPKNRPNGPTTDDWKAIGIGIMSVMKGSSSGGTVDPQYTQLLGDLQALDKSATSQTSIIQTAQGVDQQQVNTCKSSWEDCSKKLMDWIHAIVQNYQRASS